MRFPNLFWALKNWRMTHYEMAAKLQRDASHFSKCLNGRAEFLYHEKKRISQILGYEGGWLFQEVRPQKVKSHTGNHPAPAPRVGIGPTA